MLPFFIILFIIYCTQMTWIHGLKYVFTLFLVGLLAFSVFTSSMKHFPFSRKRERGERILKISFFFAILTFLGLIVLMQLIIYKHAALWWGFQGLLLLFLIVSEVIAIKRLNNVLLKIEYIS